MAAIYDHLTLNVRFGSPSETTTTEIAQRKSEEITDSLRSLRQTRSLERLPLIRERRAVSLEPPVVIQPPPVTPIYNCYYYKPPSQFYQKTRTSSYRAFNASPYIGLNYSSSPWYNYSHYYPYYPYSGLSAEATGALSELDRIGSFRYNSDVFPVHTSYPYHDYYPRNRSYHYSHLY